MDKNINDTLSQFITAEILEQPNKQISVTEPIISSGLIDSFHLVDLALFVEDRFGVHIDDTELTAANFDTIQELADLIQSRMVHD